MSRGRPSPRASDCAARVGSFATHNFWPRKLWLRAIRNSALAAVAILASALTITAPARAEPVYKSPPAEALPAMPSLPSACHFGGMIGGVGLPRMGLNSSSGFYHGSAQGPVGGYIGAFADCGLTALPGPGPYNMWVLSVAPTVDLRLSPLAFSGTGGGFPVTAHGMLTELDYMALLKLTTPLSPTQSFAIFAGPGGASLWPNGQPTGIGGPQINGADTAFALRAGAEYSWAIGNNLIAGLQASYQYTLPTTFATTLAGEDFRLRDNHSIMVGLNVVCCAAPPPPPGESTVERLTPPQEPPVTPPVTLPPVAHTPPPETPKDQHICGPDITYKVYLTLRKIAAEYKAATPAQQKAACGSLYGLTSWGHAWDIDGLDPDSANGPQPWLTRYSNACAIPRPSEVCAATVEFAGTCQHAQIVNYVMWGLVNHLCGYKRGTATGIAHARNTTYAVLRALFKHQGSPNLNEVQGSQEAMIDVGYTFQPGSALGTSLGTWQQILAAAKQKGYFKIFEPCELKCPVKLYRPPFNYIWEGLQ